MTEIPSHEYIEIKSSRGYKSCRQFRVKSKFRFKRMKLLIIFLFAQQCSSFDIPRESCISDLNIEDNHYNVSNIYHTDDAYPTDAHYDERGNIFFVEAGSNSEGYYFNARIIEANSTTPKKIPGLPEGTSYSIAIDKNYEKVYFGTSRGIFKYNYETKKATLISKPNMKCNMIFVDKNSNKYITQNIDGIEEVYLLVGDSKIQFKSLEALEEMAIDHKNNFYFIKEEKLFVLKSTLSSPIIIASVQYDGMAQISFYNDRVFIASSNLIYFHENDSNFMKIIRNVPGKVSAVAFDDDGNFVLGIHGKLIQYKKNHCYLRKNDESIEDKLQ